MKQSMQLLGAVCIIALGGLLAPNLATGSRGGCEWRHFFYDGNPTKYETNWLGDHTVPDGREWRVTNLALMGEKHHGGTANAGEFTAVVDGFDQHGDRIVLGFSSIDHGDGLGMQSMGQVNIGLEPGSRMRFFVWLRPYQEINGKKVPLDPDNFYYTLAASVKDCPA